MAGCSNSRGVNGENCDKNCKGKCSCGDGSMKGNDVDDDEDRVPGGLFDQAVLVLLRRLYAKNAIRDIRVSLGRGRSVGLFSLLYFVWERGGFDSMSRGNLWGLAAKKLDLDFGFGASLKMVYFNYLGELDQWLDGTGKGWNSMKLSDECGGNVEVLSIELEKRFRALSVKVGKIDKEVIPDGRDSICNRSRIGVAHKEDLQTPGFKKENQLLDDANVAATFDNDEREGDRSPGRPNPGFVESDSKRKRTPGGWKGMLSWLSRTAKSPLHLLSGRIRNSSERKEKGRKKYMPLALLARESLLKRKYPNSDENHGSCPQKKQKIHPSIYDDPASGHFPGIRSSKRVPALAKSFKESRAENHSKATHLENGHGHKEKTPDPPASCLSKPTEGSSPDEPSPDEQPVEKHVKVGPRFQAEIPSWTGRVLEDYSYCLGARVWPPDNWEQNTAPVTQSMLGKGRPEICDCAIPSSVDCVRLHTAENKLKLKKELGRAFYQWKFDRMGEVVSLSWAPQEEEEFKSVMTTNPLSMGKSSFPKKTRQELVDYYFNVFLQRKRSYQNRVTPNAVDSDDELSDFGSVGGLYGHAATRYLCAPMGAAPGINPGSCTQNKECLDLN